MQRQQHVDVDLTMGSMCCTLLDRRSSVPLSDARIMCVWRDNRMTRYDADRFGRFSTKMPEGVYDLVISARGYLSLLVRGVGVLAGHHQIVTRALVPGDGKEPESEPATALGGYVTDRLGRGVGNVTIHISGEKGETTYTARTDKDGAYLLHSIVPEVYDITVTAGDRRLAREIVPVASTRDFVRKDICIIQI